MSTNTTPTFSDVRGTNAAWAEGYIESCVAQASSPAWAAAGSAPTAT